MTNPAEGRGSLATCSESLPEKGADLQANEGPSSLSFRNTTFEHKVEPVGDDVVTLAEEVVATGGFLLHYNRSFADLYMEVREDD